MHIYAFGSVCRGEVLPGSDVDLLAVVDGKDERFDPARYSIYSGIRLRALWDEGNPFAWHLWSEARLLYASDGQDVLRAYGAPAPYARVALDCEKFLEIFEAARASLGRDRECTIFDLSTVFLSIRNFATCFALGMEKRAEFGRHSAKRLGGSSIPIPESAYTVLESSRLLCTRGYGGRPSRDEIEIARGALDGVGRWMRNLLLEVKKRG